MGTFSRSSRKKAIKRSQLAEVKTLPPELDSSARVELPDHHNAPFAAMESREHLPPRPPAK